MKYIQYIGIDLKLFTLLYTDGTVEENSVLFHKKYNGKKTDMEQRSLIYSYLRLL
jgi:hypothetical protein